MEAPNGANLNTELSPELNIEAKAANGELVVVSHEVCYTEIQPQIECIVPDQRPEMYSRWVICSPDTRTHAQEGPCLLSPVP